MKRTDEAHPVIVSVCVKEVHSFHGRQGDNRLSHSACEAEYISLASAIQESLYLEQLLNGLDSYKYAKTKVYKDNQGTIALTKNPVKRQRCKHIDVKYHFIRSIVTTGKVTVEYCPADQMMADVLICSENVRHVLKL